MAQLIVRHLDDSLVQALKLRAARNGPSAGAEHREILLAALIGTAGRSLKELLAAMPEGGEDQDFERARERGGEAGR
jgi:antitoxin FitA